MAGKEREEVTGDWLLDPDNITSCNEKKTKTKLMAKLDAVICRAPAGF
jgi:hypothetical protein